MASSDIENETNREPHCDESDLYNKLEVLLKKRNKILGHKEILLPCTLTDDTDLSDILEDENVPNIQQHKHLRDNDHFVSTLIDDIRKLKRSSEMEMDFVIDDEKNQDDEVNQAISRLRQQSEKLFKRIINVQVGFNECVNNNPDIIKQHTKLIEKTCQFDRGVESIIRCDKDKISKNIEKDLKINNTDEFKKLYTDLEQNVLSKVYEAGAKTSKKHEHLLAIKQYNKPERERMVVETVAPGTLDPFTRQPITKPVSNKVCKHIYDQDSVDLMFQAKSFVHCPYIGCTNKHFTKKDLIFAPNVSSNNE